MTFKQKNYNWDLPISFVHYIDVKKHWLEKIINFLLSNWFSDKRFYFNWKLIEDNSSYIILKNQVNQLPSFFYSNKTNWIEFDLEKELEQDLFNKIKVFFNKKCKKGIYLSV